MFQSRTFLWAILAGIVICSINVVENIAMVQWFYKVQNDVFSPGYGTLSILTAWINGAQMTAGEIVFFVVFPLLAAMPYSWSMRSEIHSGYSNQILIRGSKKQYLTAKYMVTFLAGGLTLASAMVFNFMANAWMLPVCAPPYIMVSGGDGMFLSRLFFSRPLLYILGCLATSFVWAGIIACLGLTVGLFIRNTVVIVLLPFLIVLGSSFLVEGLKKPISEMTILGTLETSPMQLLHAMPLNSNPAWYVWSVQLVLMALITAAYFLWGRKNEIL